MRFIKMIPEEKVDISTDAMMEWMRSVGEPTISVIDGKWRCYWKCKNGPVELMIQCDWPKQHGDLRGQVENCYTNVRRVVGSLGRR